MCRIHALYQNCHSSWISFTVDDTFVLTSVHAWGQTYSCRRWESAATPSLLLGHFPNAVFSCPDVGHQTGPSIHICLSSPATTQT